MDQQLPMIVGNENGGGPPPPPHWSGLGKKLYKLEQPPADTLDRLSPLPEDVLCRMTNFLDAQSLSRMRCVNKHFRKIASTNQAGWEALCQQLWQDKVHVGPHYQSWPNKRLAFIQSRHDAHTRHAVTREELCYDANPQHAGTVWSFRFKESAGSDWTAVDPWYRGQAARQVVLLTNGQVKEYHPASNNTSAPPTLSDPPLTMTWRFLTRPMDLPTRPVGSYVRFRVGGRDVPTYSVRRSPTGNWGFVMESCWGVYASFPLPPRIQPHQGQHLRRTEDERIRWVNESDSENDQNGMRMDNAAAASRRDHHHQHPDDAELLQDESLLITNEVQWREAFLYNVGARILPEGDEATDEFDRAWGGLH